MVILLVGGAEYPTQALLVDAGQKLEIVIDHGERRGEQRQSARPHARHIHLPIAHAANPISQAGVEAVFQTDGFRLRLFRGFRRHALLLLPGLGRRRL